MTEFRPVVPNRACEAQILGAAVRLGLHDPPDAPPRRSIADQQGAEERAGGRRTGGAEHRTRHDGQAEVLGNHFSIESGTRNPVSAKNAGIRVSRKTDPICDPSSAIHRSRRNGSSCGSGGISWM